jgi:hypothetical protein
VAFAIPINRRSTRGCKASPTISATNSRSSTSGKKSRSIEWPSGELMAGLSPTLRSIRPLSAAAKISNWNKDGPPHNLMTSPRAESVSHAGKSVH